MNGLKIVTIRGFFFAVIMILLSVSESFSQERCDILYDVFLLIGQSNMSGRGEILNEDTDTIEGVYLLDDSGRIIPAKVPLNIYSSVRKRAGVQGINPGYSFSRKVHEATGKNILLVVNARGGTTLGQWDKDGEQVCFGASFSDEPDRYGKRVSLYDEAVRRCKEAMRHGSLRAILWHQGEGNSSDPQSYLTALSVFVRDLRNDLDVSEDVPFIAGEIFEGFKDTEEFNVNLNNIGKFIKNGYCVSSRGCKAKADSTHFNREGQLLLGERYADVVIKNIYNK